MSNDPVVGKVAPSIAVANQRWAGVSVGIARYDDKLLANVPQALETAREIAKALDTLGSMRLVSSASSSSDLFVALQQGIHDARGGAFFLYFAGFVFEREGELLLAVTHTEAREKKGCVPWSDVEDLLRREKVERALVVLNVEKGSSFSNAAVAKTMKYRGLSALGSLRTFDPSAGGGGFRPYADELLRAFKGPHDAIEPFADDGRFDGVGLARFLSAPEKKLDHVTIRTGEGPVLLRDLAREMADLERSSLIPRSVRSPSLPDAAPPAAPTPPPAPAATPAPAPAPAPAPVLAPAPEPEPQPEPQPEPEPQPQPQPEPQPEPEPQPQPQPAAAPAPAPQSSRPTPAPPPPSTPQPREPPQLLERIAVGFLRKRSQARRAIPRRDNRVRVLTQGEQRAIKRVEVLVVVRAAAAGAFFGAVSGIGEMFTRSVLAMPEGSETQSVSAFVQFWALAGCFVLVSTVGEILFLYWDGLRSAHKLAEIAGIDLATDETTERAAVAGALARAALELPNPKVMPFGIDPMREASKIRLLFATLLYKAKRGVTSFVLKMVVRRIGTRVFARAYLPLLAVPVFALWNALVVWMVMREARIRVIGPSAAREIVDTIFDGKPELSPQGRIAALRAVGSSIVRRQDLHPNVLALLEEVVRRVGEPGGERVDDAERFLLDLPNLPDDEKSRVLDVLTAAIVMDGRLRKGALQLLAAAQAACGRPVDDTAARQLRQAFVDGEHLGTKKQAAA